MIFRKLVSCFLLAMIATAYLPHIAYATELIAPNYANGTRTKGEMKQFYEDVVSLLKELPGGAGSSVITLASDTFAVPNNLFAVAVAAQTGTTDTLNTATGNTRDGRWLVLRADAGDQITIAHMAGGSGQFFMQDGQALTITEKTWAIFQYNEASLRWDEVQRDSIRMPGGAARTTLTLDTNGYAVPTGFAHNVDTFSAASADNADRLTTTNKVPFVLLRQANAARAVTLRHNQGGDGTLLLSGGTNVTFSNTDQAILFELEGTTYREIGRFGFGGFLQYENKTASFTAEWNHYYLISGGATVTATLASVVGHAGEEIVIVRTGSGSVILDGNGSEPINGAVTPVTLWSAGAGQDVACTIRSTGTAAYIESTAIINISGTPLVTPVAAGGTGTNVTLNGFLRGGSPIQSLTPVNDTFVGYDGSGNAATYPVAWTVSAEQTIATSTTVSVSHSLGRNPYDFRAVLRCKTAEAGYSVGDEVLVHLTDGTANRGFCAGYNTTSCFASFSSNAIMITPKAGGANTTITPASWRVVFIYR